MKRLFPAFFAIVLAAWLGCSTDVVPEPAAAEQSLTASLRADTLLAAGDSAAAAGEYLSAALLLDPGSEPRLALAEAALGVSQGTLAPAARILLESPDERAPYRALILGGPGVAGDILPGLEAGDYRLPAYLALMAAESLVTENPGLALRFLEFSRDLPPGRASDDRLLCLYRAALGTGDTGSQEAIWNTVMGGSDDILKSRFYHHRGMARGNRGIPDLLHSFTLWPAGDVHAAAYAAIRDTVLADPSLAAELIDPFYEGGLWNEVHDIAVNSPNPPAHGVYLGARTRDRLGRYQEAVELLELYLRRWPRGEDAPNALIYLGRNLAALGRVEEALEQLDRYGADWPDHWRISNLPWYRGISLAQNGYWERAIPHFQETLDRYPGNSTADDAQFHIAMSLMNTGRTAEATEAFGNFNARWTQSVYRPASRYWYGVLKLQGGDDSGRGVLERLIADKPESLPAVFAREYLGLPPWRPHYVHEPLSVWMARNGRPEAEPPQDALDGVFLNSVGCRKWALDLFRSAEEQVGDVYRLAPYYLSHGVWERGPSAAWRIWSLENENRPLELWRLRYPDAWPEEVLSETGRNGMDPLLLWSIMKQESAFQPNCFSTAGARGLIQMIPSTSEYVAIEQGFSHAYSPDILYDPATSIMYGTACISSYSEDFNGDLTGTLAAYNGGPHNALLWGWGRMPAEEFYSLITFNETRKYVEIVSHNYVVYKHIWPEYSPGQ